MIDFLKPIAYEYSSQIIESFILVWLEKKEISNRIPIQNQLLKVSQILNCLELPVHVVLIAVNNFIDNYRYQVTRVKPKQVVTLDMSECTRESLIFHFLYTYLLHNLQFYFKREDVVQIYRNLMKFIKSFQHSRHPLTICWLLEILYIFSNKFMVAEAYRLDKKLRKEYQDLTTSLIEHCSAVLNNSINISFDKNYNLKVVFPPSVHEFIKAFEQANEVEETKEHIPSAMTGKEFFE